MSNYRSIQVNYVFYTIFSLLLFLLYPLIVYGEADLSNKEEGIVVTNERASVHIRDAELSDFFKEFEKLTKIEVILESNLAGRKLTAYFDNTDTESAIRQIIDQNNLSAVLYFSLNPITPGAKRLNRVKVGSDSIGAIRSSKTIKSIGITYGSGTEEVGAVSGTEGSSMGPRSFTADDKGDIYVCDTVNSRIQVFSTEGVHKLTIPIKVPTMPDDIAVDKKGFIYVYDRAGRRLYQYTPTGLLNGSVAVDDTRWYVARDMYLVGNNIIMNACSETSCGDVIMGTISKNDSLLPPTKRNRKGLTREANMAKSGRQYKTKEISGGRALIEITGENGDTSQISFPISGLASARFLGEDVNGNFYIKTGIEEQERVGHIEIQKFNKNMDYVDSTLVPSRISEFWSANDIHVSENGKFYIFTPKADMLCIDVISP